MPTPIDYDMTAVRTAYANLKARLVNAKAEQVDMEESERYRLYSRGKAVAYAYSVEQFLEIFGPSLEEVGPCQIGRYQLPDDPNEGKA